MIIVQIAGRLGKKPESRFTPSGQKVTNFSVATSVRKAGKEETVWWRVTVWGDRYDKMISFLDKGSAVIIVGEMNKPDMWTDKEGRSQLTLELTAEIIRFSPFGNPDRPAQEQSSSGQYSQQNDNQHSGIDSGMADFGAPAQGNAAHPSPSGYGVNPTTARYSQPVQTEDPLPF